MSGELQAPIGRLYKCVAAEAALRRNEGRDVLEPIDVLKLLKRLCLVIYGLDAAGELIIADGQALAIINQ